MSDFSIPTTYTDNLDLKNIDNVVQNILHKFTDSADLDRTDLKMLDWIDHAQKKLMDRILYLEKLRMDISEKKGNVKNLKVLDDYTNCKYYRT